MKDFYYILGVETNCTQAEVREAYRKLSKKFHPDLNGNDHYFESRFKDIREAYETLSDPAGRVRYNNTLKKFKADPSPKEKTKLLSSSKINFIDIGFTAMLALLTCVFGFYVYRSVYGSKKAKVNAPLVAGVIPVKTVHHKKKHSLLEPTIAPIVINKKANQPVKDTTRLIAVINKPIPHKKDTVAVRQSKPVQNAVNPMKYVSEPINKVNEQSVGYIKANATGVVYMRLADNYTANVVSIIPDKSKVMLLEKGTNFYKVQYNNQTGYVPKWTIRN